MREIKFRAWDYASMCQVVKIDMWSDDPKEWELELYDPITEEEVHVDFDEIILMQHIGLKDAKGTPIYEGDILRCKVEDRSKSSIGEWLPKIEYRFVNLAVEWWQSHCLIGHRLRNKSLHFMIKPSALKTMEVEVIGNIYENPELLE